MEQNSLGKERKCFCLFVGWFVFQAEGAKDGGHKGHWVGVGDDDMACGHDEVGNPIWLLAVGVGPRERKGNPSDAPEQRHC